MAAPPLPQVNSVGSEISHKAFRLSLGTSLANLLAVAAHSAAGFDRPIN